MKILKTTLSIVLFVFAVITVNAQDKDVKKEKEFKIKIIKEVDGEKFELDTVITGDIDDDELKEIFKKYNVTVDFDEELHGQKKHVVIDIDKEHMDGKKMKFIHTGDDDDVIVKHFEGDSLIIWHEKDGDHTIEKHIIVEVDDEAEGEKKVKVIHISDDEKVIIKELEGDEATWHIMKDEDLDGKHKKIEVRVEVDGDEITIEEVETDEDGVITKEKKKVKKNK